MELRLLSIAIDTEIIRREEKKHPSEEDKIKIGILNELGERISEEKLEVYRRLKERKGIVL